jgi:hypothetical protein
MVDLKAELKPMEALINLATHLTRAGIWRASDWVESSCQKLSGSDYHAVN